MTKDQLEEVVLDCIEELNSQEMSDSQAQLMIGFVDNMRQRAVDADQADRFASELEKKLQELKMKP